MKKSNSHSTIDAAGERSRKDIAKNDSNIIGVVRFENAGGFARNYVLKWPNCVESGAGGVSAAKLNGSRRAIPHQRIEQNLSNTEGSDLYVTGRDSIGFWGKK